MDMPRPAASKHSLAILIQRKRRWCALPLLACVVGLGACAVLDPPTSHEIQAQSTPLAAIAPDADWHEKAVAGTVTDNWLSSFGDAQLDALVGEAIAHNPDLQVAAVLVEQAQQYVIQAQAALLPGINIFGTGGLNMGGGDVNSALQGISLGASWEPDLWGRLRYGRNATQATYESAEADLEFGRQSLAATVAKSWFTATETLLQTGIARETTQVASELVRLAEKRMEVGPGNEQEVLLARANLGNLQDAERQLQYAHTQAVRALELLLGRYPGAELQARAELVALPADVPAGLPLEMLERRPDMLAAERRVAAAFNRVGEAKAARLPRIILNANIAAIDSNVVDLKKDFENPIGGAGAKLIAPIFQGGELKAQVEIRTLEQKQAVIEYARLALRALADVEGALAAGHSLAERVPLLQDSLDYNLRALGMVQTSVRVGQADQRAAGQQQLSVNAARLALLRVQAEQLAQRVNLHLALGGNFTIPSTDADLALK
ncbi:MAG: efflux transporter outer membrane subunit [Gammaproteobacteria bacterium]|nr:efflux transporter outer membrane subunit [Gammaproteobacteria bacterium]MBK7168216.1 efflux transporter outer membrane subunit [Gammaproteobacteria bacterium]MBK7519025.1 efflux transporter outer membrane subunit [Gammaproteobacteria bacterium]MBK7730233.1 efflux transporter outer membrane subunit [Gammaproteobacteria bacterium]MBK8306049.1 efflux transporter outer membrane subunit [Gammaproteobacteria bacterium]